MRAALFALVTVLSAIPAAAAPPIIGSAVLGQVETERRVSLELKEVPLRQAVALLFDGSAEQFSIDPNVPDVSVTLVIHEVSVPAGLRLLIRQAATIDPLLTSSRDGDVYLIRKRSIHPVPPPVIASLPRPAQERRVTLSLRDVPLHSALPLLFRGSGVQFLVSPGVPSVPINLTLRDIPLQQAFRLMIRQAAVLEPAVTTRRDGDVVVVRMLPGR